MPHFITLTLVEWIDMFNRKKYKDIIIDNLIFCVKNKCLVIHAYVIMPNHIHMIVSSSNNTSLSKLIGDFKRYTARILYKTLVFDKTESRRNWLLWVIETEGRKSSSNKNIKVWRHENHPVALDNSFITQQRITYIHQNPVKAGICYTAEDYVYSSARVYAGEAGVMDVEVLG